MIGIILAGGLATRLGGGDKGLRRVGDVPILERVIATMRPQCTRLVINANGSPDRLARYGLPIVADTIPGHPGPLAGVLAGLDFVAAHHPAEPFAVTVASDTPFLPTDLVSRLAAARHAAQADIASARSNGTVHGVAALWSVALRRDLRRFIVEEGLRKVGLFAARYRCATVDWPGDPVDPFFNANTARDLAEADRMAQGLAGS